MSSNKDDPLSFLNPTSSSPIPVLDGDIVNYLVDHSNAQIGSASGSFQSDSLLGGGGGVDSATAELEFGILRPDFRESLLVGTVDYYDRHVFLCYKNPRNWPPRIEAAEFDRLPRLLSAAMASRKGDMKKETRLTICEGHDGTETSNGDVLIFPDMVRYRYYSDSWLLEDPTRVPPHRDAEVSAERTKCFRRLFPNSDLCKRAISEYALFSLKSGPFNDAITISMMDSGDPKVWWANFGAPIPLLQGLAIKILGQPASSSCCERNWSTYSFIHSMKRNRLTPTRAEDLVFTHNNLRLLSRNSPAYSHPKSKMWDVGGDQFGSMEETDILEFAELTLDEPDLEEEFISDDI